LPSEVFEENFPNVRLSPVNVKLVTYSGHGVTLLRQEDVTVGYNSQEFQLPLVVVKLERNHQPPLLERNWLQYLKLDLQRIFGSEEAVLITARS
jgi:hypothetical protein